MLTVWQEILLDVFVASSQEVLAPYGRKHHLCVGANILSIWYFATVIYVRSTTSQASPEQANVCDPEVLSSDS